MNSISGAADKLAAPPFWNRHKLKIGVHRNMRPQYFLMAALLLLLLAFPAAAQSKRKVILDQDARGPATTDQQSMLLLLQAPEADVLGITIVSGDQWRDEE